MAKLGWTGKGPFQLGDEHDIDGFDCGNEHINRWIANHARGNARRFNCKVFVYLEQDSNVVAGLFAVTMRSIHRESLSNKYRANSPNSGVPAYFIGQFAVASKWQGLGLGRLMLDGLYTFLREQMIGGIPAPLVYLDAVDDHAAAFWMRHGFTHFPKINNCSYIRGTEFLREFRTQC